MKTKEYPIKELVRFEMDENKIWWVKYKRGHESFPERHKITKRSCAWDTEREYFEDRTQNIKEYKDLLKQTSKFCYSNEFILENGNSKMVTWNHKDFSWSKKGVLSNSLPELLFPTVILDEVWGEWNYSPPLNRDDFRRIMSHGLKPKPYYGNPHYKKYIEDNNGECPLPFPKDAKWRDTTEWWESDDEIYGGLYG